MSEISKRPSLLREVLRRSLVPLLIVGIPLFLVLVIPYAAGYSSGRDQLAVTLKRMWGYEEWQHCWLVVPAVAFIVYSQRKQLAALPLRGTLFGLIPLLAALFLFWAGYRVENYYLGFFAIQLLIGGLILFLAGWRWMWALLFPFLFLGFVWPLYFLENSIAFPLRMVMSYASVGVLNGIGVPVVLNGTGILSAPNLLLGLPAGKAFSVDVADPCSGIRSLFALMMVSALYGHFTLQTWWQKLILFASSVPLAVLGNLVRILTLTLGTMMFGSEFAIGKDALNDPSWFHMVAGYVVFAVALAGMVGISSLLQIDQETFHSWRSRLGSLMKSHSRETSPSAPRTSDAPSTSPPPSENKDIY